jgi:hypothetical protein
MRHSGTERKLLTEKRRNGKSHDAVECSFTVKKIEAQFDRYCHVVDALPHKSLRLLADLVESPPTENPYDDIKERLVASSTLRFPEGREAVSDASGGQPEALRDDGGHVGDLPQGRGEDEPVRLHFSAAPSQRDQSPAGKSGPQGPEGAV